MINFIHDRFKGFGSLTPGHIWVEWDDVVYQTTIKLIINSVDFFNGFLYGWIGVGEAGADGSVFLT